MNKIKSISLMFPLYKDKNTVELMIKKLAKPNPTNSSNKYFSHYVLKKLFLIYSKKILEKIICKGIIASEYLGRIKKMDTIDILAIKNNIKKLILWEFLSDKIIPTIEVIPMNNTGK